MTRKQYELKGIVHRCRHCGRELKSKKSIARKAGAKCHKKHTKPQ